jgi:ABC-type glutathione transport system ATPase component
VLSGEQKEQVLLGRALCRRPKILLLDEVNRHLDVASKALIDQAIASPYITRIMSPLAAVGDEDITAAITDEAPAMRQLAYATSSASLCCSP